MKVLIEFKQTVTYAKEVEMDEDSFYNLQDWEENVVSETSPMEIFGLLSSIASAENIIDAERRFVLVNVEELSEEDIL